MKKTKNIILVCLCVVLIFLISLLVLFFIKKSNKDDEIKNITTTTISTTQKTDLVLENGGVELTVSNTELASDTKLHIERVDVKLKDVNALEVYDITLKDSEGNVINVNNTNIKIAIPYENKYNYTKFTILYLNDVNAVLETYNANYVDGKVIFNVNHLSRYAIVGEKEEKTTTTSKISTTKNTTTKTITTAKPTTTTTINPSTKTTTTTKSTTKTPTTTTTTTKKVVTYTIKVTSIDQYSPDRQLTVYENGTKINVSEIKYNGVTLCKGNNMVVNMFELEGINKVTVVLTNGNSVTATIQ